MAKSTFPNASNDFHKTNGVDARTFNNDPSLTRQEYQEECDINTLMKKYENHAVGGPGMMLHQDPTMFYADFTELPEDLMGYHAYMDKAQFAFMALPATVRKEFNNDPVQFVEFAADPENLPQMQTWGLAPAAKKDPPPMKVEVVPAPGAPPEPAKKD